MHIISILLHFEVFMTKYAWNNLDFNYKWSITCHVLPLFIFFSSFFLKSNPFQHFHKIQMNHWLTIWVQEGNRFHFKRRINQCASFKNVQCYGRVIVLMMSPRAMNAPEACGVLQARAIRPRAWRVQADAHSCECNSMYTPHCSLLINSIGMW